MHCFLSITQSFPGIPFVNLLLLPIDLENPLAIDIKESLFKPKPRAPNLIAKVTKDSSASLEKARGLPRTNPFAFPLK
jgi:hypothetical protein